jgi:hypothetical protein
MIWSISMLKIIHRHWILTALPIIWLLTVLTIGGGNRAPGIATAEAATLSRAEARAGCTGAYHRPSFGSNMVITSGEVICSNLTSLGGNVVIRGEVQGDVVAFGGDVVIDGTVIGNITLYGGNITVQDDAFIKGDIHLCGGHWLQGDDSHLHGSVIDCTGSIGQLLLGDWGIEMRLWSLITWNALGLLLTTLLPEHVMLVRTTATHKIRRSLVLGLLSILLAPIVLAVLIALIIPVPLAIIVAIGLIAAWALGTVAIGWHIGDYIVRTVTPQHNTRLLQVLVGLTVLILAGSLPYIGWLFSIGAGLLGLGAVLLSRFGTRLYSQPKQPLPL